jgi:hypothetical protein
MIFPESPWLGEREATKHPSTMGDHGEGNSLSANYSSLLFLLIVLVILTRG